MSRVDLRWMDDFMGERAGARRAQAILRVALDDQIGDLRDVFEAVARMPPWEDSREWVARRRAEGKSDETFEDDEAPPSDLELIREWRCRLYSENSAEHVSPGECVPWVVEPREDYEGRMRRRHRRDAELFALQRLSEPGPPEAVSILALYRSAASRRR